MSDEYFIVLSLESISWQVWADAGPRNALCVICREVVWMSFLAYSMLYCRCDVEAICVEDLLI